MVRGDNNVVRRDYAVRRYANNKRKQSFVAEFFPDVNQITSHTHRPLPFSNPLERFWYSGRWGGGWGARMRAGRRDSLYDSSRDQFAAANSPKLLWTLERVHTHVRALFDAHASCARTRTISRPRRVGVDRKSIRSHAFGRCRDASWHVAREEREREKVGGGLCTAYSGVAATLGMKRRAHIGKGAIVARRLRIRGDENNGRRSDAKRRSNKIYREFLPRSSFSFNIPCARGVG